MSFLEGTNYQANREDKNLPMFDNKQTSTLSLNKWYEMKDFKSEQKFICLVKFNTIDAGNEYRLMSYNGKNWYDYPSKERRFEDRITEYMPIEFI